MESSLQVVAKAPSTCSADEISGFIALVTAAGEVACRARATRQGRCAIGVPPFRRTTHWHRCTQEPQLHLSQPVITLPALGSPCPKIHFHTSSAGFLSFQRLAAAAIRITCCRRLSHLPRATECLPLPARTIRLCIAHWSSSAP